MIKLNKIKIRNFLSFGNCTQEVELNSQPLTVIMGINNDATTNDDADETRNGTGKSSIIQAINFSLYGKSIDNRIKVNNLVNKTNKKNCEVQIEFEKDGNQYTIARGKNPAFLKLFINSTEFNEKENQAQGENKDTQEVINEILGVSNDLFSQIVTLTTSTELFLNLSTAKQRAIIEELFLITRLSQKAEKLKENLRDAKEAADREKFRISTTESSNEKIRENIKLLEQKEVDFNILNKNQRTEKEIIIKKYQYVDWKTEQEILNEISQIQHIKERLTSARLTLSQQQLSKDKWTKEREDKVEALNQILKELQHVDIKAELDNHNYKNLWLELQQLYNSNIKKKNDLENQQIFLKSQLKSLSLNLENLESRLNSAKNQRCPECNSSINNHEHHGIVSKYEQAILETNSKIVDINNQIDSLTTEINSIEFFDMPNEVTTVYPTLNEAINHQYKIESIEKDIQNLLLQTNPYVEIINQTNEKISGYEDSLNIVKRESIFSTLHEMYSAKSLFEQCLNDYTRLTNETNPYTDQILSLKSNSLVQIDYTEINRLRKLIDHQEFLLRILTDKNSFVRQKIIDQHLAF